MIWPRLLHPGSRWMPSVLISSETGSEWRTILEHPQLIECMGICDLSLARGSEPRGFNVYLHIAKKIFGNFSLISSARVRALWWPLPGFFFLDFSQKKKKVLEGSAGQIIYRPHGITSGLTLAAATWTYAWCSWRMGKVDRGRLLTMTPCSQR